METADKEPIEIDLSGQQHFYSPLSACSPLSASTEEFSQIHADFEIQSQSQSELHSPTVVGDPTDASSSCADLGDQPSVMDKSDSCNPTSAMTLLQSYKSDSDTDSCNPSPPKNDSDTDLGVQTPVIDQSDSDNQKPGSCAGLSVQTPVMDEPESDSQKTPNISDSDSGTETPSFPRETPWYIPGFWRFSNVGN